MKRWTYSNAALKAVLLKDRYPNSNGVLMMKHTTLTCNVMTDTVTMDTNLPEDHWAFTHTEEPKPRYRLRDNKEDVFDSVTDETLGYMRSPNEAADYMAFLNLRHERNQG